MPKLDDATRKSIEERDKIWGAIRQSYDGKRWVPVCCFLCNWTSNGKTFKEAEAENNMHQQVYHSAELKALEEARIPIHEWWQSVHDHDCEMVLCSCICGCDGGPYCRQIGGALCPECSLGYGRGSDSHGIKEPV